MSIRSGLVLAVAGGLLVAGCSTVHPGSAAVVDDQAITMAAADKASDGYCKVMLISAAQQGTGRIDNTIIRQRALSDLIVEKVLDRELSNRGDKLPERSLSAQEKDQLTELLDAEAVDNAVEVIERNGRVADGLIALARAEGIESDNEQELLEAGQQLLVDLQASADIDIDPRFGFDQAGNPTGDIGSLSVPAVSLDDRTVDDMPDVLVCS